MLWDAQTGSTASASIEPIRIANSTTFSADGQWLVGTDGTSVARVVEVGTGRSVAELRGHAAPVLAARWSPDGKLLVTASADGTAQMYRCDMCIPIPELLALARTRVTRDLRPEERERFLSGLLEPPTPTPILAIPPTATPRPTATIPRPTSTLVPTDTPLLPATPLPPTATPAPPTETPAPPTEVSRPNRPRTQNTPQPPTETPDVYPGPATETPDDYPDPATAYPPPATEAPTSDVPATDTPEAPTFTPEGPTFTPDTEA
jgi:hypothetical protein